LNDNYIIMIISYLLGAIPSGYLLLKFLHSKDIRDSGSGNVGAMNSYESTGNKLTGIIVFLIDFAKGVATVLIANEIAPSDTYSLMMTTVFCVLGHNYNVFLKFSGGRGLAPAAGILLIISPIGLFLWCLMYLSSYFVFTKNIHVANFAASITAPILFFGMPGELTTIANWIIINDFTQLKIGYALIAFLIILRHAGPLRELIKSSENISSKNDGID
jgi:acyl phosphate:glycerol-3-phosphate acyltransferase